MAVLVRNQTRLILRAQSLTFGQKANISFKQSFQKWSKKQKVVIGVLGASAVGIVGAGAAISASVLATELELHPAKLPWDHAGMFDAIDHASARRGYQVYKQVCAACHSMDYMYYRNMVDHIMTEDEAKAEAADILVLDGPNEQGDMFERPGKLADKFSKPYKNDEEAKSANNGALPPDLSFIVNARHGEEDYLFALLTGYCDAPEGVTVGEEQHYNPYFAGGLIGMAQALFNEVIEYEDGTPATASQMAKDVCVFLRWAAEPETDERKRMGMKALMVFGVLIATTFYYKRHKWTTLKNRKIAFKPRRH